VTLNATEGSLLGLLHSGPMTGWELLQTVEQSLGCFWNVTTSHVYRELKRLEEKGLIEAGQPGVRDKRPFSLTDAGRAAFAGWIAQEPGEEIIRFPLLVTLFFGRHLDPDQLAGFLENHRRIHQRRLANYRALEEVVGDDPYCGATVRFGIAYEEATLNWFDSLPFRQEP
jgi:DNA-binding PadR family transcriptional regulator